MESELPDDVVLAIHANRKIDAIKLLREHRGLGLKEAKQTVDAYAAKHPHLIAKRGIGEESGIRRVILIASIIIGIYVAYRFLK